jgi:hypothetical protein
MLVDSKVKRKSERNSKEKHSRRKIGENLFTILLIGQGNIKLHLMDEMTTEIQ